MEIEKRLKDHYKRWNIEFSYEEEFAKFKNRIIRVVDKHVGNYLVKNPAVDRHFYATVILHYAEEPRVKKSGPDYSQCKPIQDLIGSMSTSLPSTEEGFGNTSVYKFIKDSTNSQDLASTLQFLFWTLESRHDETKDIVSRLVIELKKLALLSPSASFQIHIEGKEVILYPCGDAFLDEQVIDCTLSYLDKYPQAAKYFQEALKIYQGGDTNQYRNLLDNLRFSLEQLLKKTLEIEKAGLNRKELKSALGERFTQKGLHVQVSNLYVHLLITYDEYQNRTVKHDEKFSLDEVEFMIYLTGIFMRLILQIEK